MKPQSLTRQLLFMNIHLSVLNRLTTALMATKRDFLFCFGRPSLITCSRKLCLPSSSLMLTSRFVATSCSITNDISQSICAHLGNTDTALNIHICFCNYVCSSWERCENESKAKLNSRRWHQASTNDVLSKRYSVYNVVQTCARSTRTTLQLIICAPRRRRCLTSLSTW